MSSKHFRETVKVCYTVRVSEEDAMKRIGLILLACCVVCLIVGVILFPTKKRLIVDVSGIATAAVWFVLGYIFGQAGLLFFVVGMNNEQLKTIEQHMRSLFLEEGKVQKLSPPVAHTSDEINNPTS